jgi:hypothetical protein
MASVAMEAVDLKNDYEQAVVDINTFLDDPEYLGDYFEGRGFGDENNYWRKVLQEIFRSPSGSDYWLVAFKGAVGTGKTTTACAGMAYDLYRLLCYRHPQRMLEVPPTEKIEFAIFNVTLTLAGDVVWDRITQMISSSPWFSRVVDITRKKKRGETLFPKRIDLYSGSRVGHSRGRGVYEVIIDEANFEVIGGQVRESFYSLLRRIQSRFMKVGGGFPGRIWVASSETEKSSVLNQLIEQHRKQSGVIVRHPALWDVKPEKYTRGWFKVYKGSETRPPDIIDGTNEQLYAGEPENIISVPEEHRPDFMASIQDALRDQAGISTGSRYKLFQQRDKLIKALCVELRFPESFELDFEDDTDQIIDKVLIRDYFSPNSHPHWPRFIHVDIGLSGDRLGFACCYISGFKEVQKRDTADFQKVAVVEVPELVVEFAFGIKAKAGQQIPLLKVYNFIQSLRDRRFSFNSITTDGYESAFFLQLMTRMGIEAHELSMEKTSKPYRKLRTLVYGGLVHLPQSKLLQRELEELELSPDGRKVDHPEKHPDGTPGSKDVADACCGAVCNALEREIGMRMFYQYPPPLPPLPVRRYSDTVLDWFWDDWRERV